MLRKTHVRGPMNAEVDALARRWRAQPPGIVARTEDELLDAFRHATPWADTTAKARDAFRARFCPWDDGQAAERAVRRVFLQQRP